MILVLLLLLRTECRLISGLPMVSLGGHSDWLLNSLVVRNSHFLMRVANSKIVIVWQNALRFTARSQFTA